MNSNNDDDNHYHHRSNVSSSEDATSSTKEAQVSTTTNEDNNTNSSSSGSSSDQDDSSSNGPTTTSSSTTPPPSSSSNILRPSVFLRPSSFNSTSSSTPTITITPDDESTPKPSASSTTYLRPSKLKVKEPLNTAPEKPQPSSSNGDKPSNVFVPLTKDSNSVNGDKAEIEENKASEEVSGSGEFLFGEKLEDRVSSSQDRKRKISGDDDNNEQAGTSGGECSSRKVPALEDVDISTGEEAETNVMQIPCRLFAYDPANQNWTERVSRGVLRLNDTDTTNSRLIVRTQGSLRLCLNTKIYNGMIVERPNDKSVRLTAVDIQDEGNVGGVKVFLVMGSYSDMDSFYSAMQSRLRRFNQQ